MSEIPDHPDCREGETAYEYRSPWDVVFQRTCTGGCIGGLLLFPARFCQKCHGSGYLLRYPKINGMQVR